jgi:DNA-directed RNA polymerase subunit N (RpoN/RPB10)
MSAPIKCTTCNTVFGQKWPDYEVMIAQDPPYPMSMAADAVCLTNDSTMECCLRHFITHPYTHRKMLHFEEQTAPLAPVPTAPIIPTASTEQSEESLKL